MGRKKISIQPIAHSTTRRTTFEKRRIGLLKKAMELSILCKSAVSLSIYTDDGEVFIYSSEPYENIIQKFQNYGGSYRLLTNDHLHDMIPGKAASTDVGYQVSKKPAVNVNKQINQNVTNNNQINTNTSILMPPISSNNDVNVFHPEMTINTPIQLQTRQTTAMPIKSGIDNVAPRNHFTSNTITDNYMHYKPNQMNQTMDIQKMSEDNTISTSDTFMISNSTSNTDNSMSVSVSETQSNEFKYIGKRRKFSDIEFESNTYNNTSLFMQHHNDSYDEDIDLELPDVDFDISNFMISNKRRKIQ